MATVGGEKSTKARAPRWYALVCCRGVYSVRVVVTRRRFVVGTTEMPSRTTEFTRARPENVRGKKLFEHNQPRAMGIMVWGQVGC